MLSLLTWTRSSEHRAPRERGIANDVVLSLGGEAYAFCHARSVHAASSYHRPGREHQRSWFKLLESQTCNI